MSQLLAEEPERPPTSGPGSGLASWTCYAVEVTGTPEELWAGLNRDEIVDLLDRGELPSGPAIGE